MESKKRKFSDHLEIPEAIIFNILKRLPAKTLMRFKCVCKTWLALILDPYFAESHHVQAQSRSDASYLLLYHGQNSLFAQAIIPADPEANISAQIPTHSFYKSLFHPCSGIVNGLIICLSEAHRKVCILNLTTGEQRQLPKHKNTPSGYQLYNPSYFLGFDPITKNYKVVYLHKYKNKKRVEECQILTLGSKSWRKIDCPLSNLVVERSVSLNGAIYLKEMDKSERSISFFDVAEEKFLKLYPPQGAALSLKQITQVGNNFGMICRSNSETGKVNLWTLKHEDQVWQKQELFLRGNLISKYDVIGSTRSGEILLTLKQDVAMYNSSSRFLILYNLTTGKCRNVEITRPGQHRMTVDALLTDVAFAAVSNHVENILPLGSFT